MTIQELFFNSVKRGTGEAHLLIKAHPKIDFSEYILKGAIKNYDYDPQSNGSRSLYVSELIKLSPKKDKLLEGVLKALAKEKSDTWALVQLFEIAEIFAKEGNTQAKQAIYKRYYKYIIPGSDWCGESSIIRLDGLEGLKHIAKIKGKAMLKNPELWEDDSVVRDFQKDHPNLKVFDELENAAKKNVHIKKYLDSVKAAKKQSKSYKQKKEISAYAKVCEILETRNFYNGILYTRIPYPLAMKLKATQIKKFAKDFLNETDKIKQTIYLSIFERVKFPFDYHPILELAKGKNDKKTRFIEFANEALSLFKAKDIREFAISMLNTTKEPYLYLPLLINNYTKGDHKLLKKLANNAKNAEQAHRLVWSYVEIYEKNKTAECKEPLEALYNKLDCGGHRYDILKILRENRVLPKKMKQEMQFDSYIKTRELFSKLS